MGAAAPGAARDSAALVLAADLAGTFVFAAQGALKAMAGDLDLFGVLVLAFVTALGGGIIRDLLIGAAPPSALRDWRYAAIAFFAGALAFALRPLVAQVPAWLVVGLDAAGLGLFAVAGAEKALAFGIAPFIAILMGGITGVGGGTIRDLLLMQIPVVLRVDVYATAALLGAVVVVVGRSLRLPDLPAAILGGLACFLLRIVAVWQHWQLPHAVWH
jgi:uncharacterized membrane protein YeiH